ncbi:conserved hypothetical protein [Pseudomonas sp. 8Z]|uniref:hypothetical protein n=1 Tax=Pseudomonas sp. 8Z TaxID=2653166 RepID=UPI0012EFA862|nr:hypothetical protein [Pseudomonas sp. 8Z]VXC58368.1 conserved hypothetical protein [Pseudomonas sp. 8Z]
MTSINNSTAAMLSYYGKQASSQAAASTSDSTSQASSDPLTDLRRLAKHMVASSEGGLLRALNGGTSLSSSAPVTQAGKQSSAGIQLPDVASLDRDEAAKLLEQLQKLDDSGLGQTLGFNGSNGEQKTDSLQTYQQWLQAKGGISVYA